MSCILHLLFFAASVMGWPPLSLSADASVSLPRQVTRVVPSDDLVAVLANATPGDVLMLSDGVYTPKTSIDVGATRRWLVINKNITIAAQNPGQAVIDGKKLHRTVLSIVKPCEHLNVLFKGLNITGGGGNLSYTPTYGGGLFIEGGTVALDSCNIYGNTASGNEAEGGGLYIAGGTVKLGSCNIHDNIAVSAGGGLRVSAHALDEEGRVTLDRCNIYDNFANNQGGGLYSDVNVTLKNCNIYGNQAGYGGAVYLATRISPSFSNCSIYSNVGIYSGSRSQGGGIVVERGGEPPVLDKESSVWHNVPNDCVGFTSPACGRQALLPIRALA